MNSELLIAAVISIPILVFLWGREYLKYRNRKLNDIAEQCRYKRITALNYEGKPLTEISGDQNLPEVYFLTERLSSVVCEFLRRNRPDKYYSSQTFSIKYFRSNKDSSFGAISEIYLNSDALLSELKETGYLNNVKEIWFCMQRHHQITGIQIWYFDDTERLWNFEIKDWKLPTCVKTGKFL